MTHKQMQLTEWLSGGILQTAVSHLHAQCHNTHEAEVFRIQVKEMINEVPVDQCYGLTAARFPHRLQSRQRK